MGEARDGRGVCVRRLRKKKIKGRDSVLLAGKEEEDVGTVWMGVAVRVSFSKGGSGGLEKMEF